MEKVELQAAQARDEAERERIRQDHLKFEKNDREFQNQMDERLKQLMK